MRNITLFLKLLWFRIIGRGPWLVVGQYYDDEGRLCRFRTGASSHTQGLGWSSYRMTFDNIEDAEAYCDRRNDAAITDPLDTTYYVWHELEFNHWGT